MTRNEQIAKEFAEQFEPPLQYIRTERINGIRMADAWQITYWDSDRGIGITAVVHSLGLHAYLEAAGKGDIAKDAGQAMATALGLLKGQTP